MWRRSRNTFCVAVLVISVSAACGEDSVPGTPDDSPASVPRASQGAGEKEVESKSIEQYIKALDSGEPHEMKRVARNFAAEESVAYFYMLHQTYSLEANLDAGYPPSVGTPLNRQGDSYETCGVDPATGRELCARFSDFKIKDDTVTDFEINGKSPGDRMTVGNGSVIASGDVSVEFLTAYQSIQSDALVVTLKVSAGKGGYEPFAHSAIYRATNGKQRVAAESASPSSINENSNAVISLLFDGMRPGGQVVLEGCSDNCNRDVKSVISIG